MFGKYGDFRTDLGPRPGSEMRSEDTEFGNRLLAGGERLRYEPSAIVYHEVSEQRLRKQYFLTWWFAKARADVREFGGLGIQRRFVGWPRLYVALRLASWALRWMAVFEPSRRFTCKLAVWKNAGMLVESWRR
jgi:GT2 family glycosyltransferase